MDIENRIADLAAPAAAESGLIVDGVEVAKSGGQLRVVVTVDLPDDELGSASLDAIAGASRAIGAALDEANVPDTAYTLEVDASDDSRPILERLGFLPVATTTPYTWTPG